jgi:REP element-mobilizing transposase RayT
MSPAPANPSNSKPLPVRRSPRWTGYDYRQRGAYFVTTNTHDWQRLFGRVREGVVYLSWEGHIAAAQWQRVLETYPHVTLDAFVVMPHHVHAILLFAALGEGGEQRNARRRQALPEVVRAYKSFSARAINEARGTPGARVWHRSFHDRIIRDGEELEAVRRYIALNPVRWKG